MKSPWASAFVGMVVSFLGQVAASSATLSGGSATIDYDKAGWDALAADFGAPLPVLTLDEFFDQAAANARTGTQILTDEVQVNPSYTGQLYAMNGATVTNLAGRATQPTTFAFTPGNPESHSGSVGLGGVAQFEVSAAAGGGHLLYGDFTLQYDAARLGLGGTGWYLKGNISPSAAAFDLLNVSVVETANSLTISGDLGVSFEVANFLYNTPADAGRDVGSFTFTAQVVPEPSATILLFAVFVGAAGFCRRKICAR